MDSNEIETPLSPVYEYLPTQCLSHSHTYTLFLPSFPLFCSASLLSIYLSMIATIQLDDTQQNHHDNSANINCTPTHTPASTPTLSTWTHPSPVFSSHKSSTLWPISSKGTGDKQKKRKSIQINSSQDTGSHFEECPICLRSMHRSEISFHASSCFGVPPPSQSSTQHKIQQTQSYERNKGRSNQTVTGSNYALCPICTQVGNYLVSYFISFSVCFLFVCMI